MQLTGHALRLMYCRENDGKMDVKRKYNEEEKDENRNILMIIIIILIILIASIIYDA